LLPNCQPKGWRYTIQTARFKITQKPQKMPIIREYGTSKTETNGGPMAMLEGCPHVKEIKNVKPSANGCEECLKMGDQWVHLRMCLMCGHVGCCDSSKNKHATKHFHRSKHAIMQSVEPGENWRWCYVDEIMLD
jgi:uncharacterized UBP type Zn finger protein